MFRIESFLSARLFVSPQRIGNRLFFLSNLSGHISLYAMNLGGSVPEPLLPPNIALQNPELIGGYSFFVFPAIQKIIVMLDQDGDENYQPMLIDVEGGFPQPVFEGQFARSRSHLVKCDIEKNIVYFLVESRDAPVMNTYQASLSTGEIKLLASSEWGLFPAAYRSDHKQAVLVETYSVGDDVIYLSNEDKPDLKLLYGTPLTERQPDQQIPLTGIMSASFTPDEKSVLFLTALFTDTYGLAWMDLNQTSPTIHPVHLEGIQHTGMGEMVGLEHLEGNRYAITFNIDGCSWLYSAFYDAENHSMRVENVICGKGALTDGVLLGQEYDRASRSFALSFSTATSPTQIYTIDGDSGQDLVCHTHERVFGIADQFLSAGEDGSFTSFDGTRISARLYRPAVGLGFDGPRPLIYYVHGGPQGQERPDFAWFSMPLIQFMTLNGFAVFVPNVRGSTGYGLSYTKKVDRDWGGQDRLDHIHALSVLAKDPGLDVSRAGVVGRSYGGYMTLTLVGRHPDCWSAAVDMFGPFDLLTFSQRIPETWKPYFRIALGDPEEDRDFLIVRSPKTYIDQIRCPLLVVQGKNDPRVVEQESHELVDHLQNIGKQVDYIVFENEGHDVLKYENRVRCYTAITDFFKQQLKP